MTTTNGRTVLLVDDERCVRLALECALVQAGYSVLVAEDGQEGLELFQTHQDAISIVVTDLEMPRLSGPLLAREVLQKRPALAILYMSGGNGLDFSTKEQVPSNQAYLQKPFAIADFLAVVKQIVG
jgi:DNA-binding NtrC family response regulator